MASFLIKDVRIFTGQETIDNGSVLVENGKIAKVSSTNISYSGKTISKPNHTLIPGLIDAHIHADKGNPVALPQSLRLGVTTVCDMHNEYVNVQKLRKQAEGPDAADFKCTSFAATIDGGWPAAIVTMHDKSDETMAELATWPKLTDQKSVDEYIKARLDEKVDYIKLMHESGTALGATFPKPSVELQKMIVDGAHKHGLKAVCHSLSLEDTIEALGCGVNGMTHTFSDQPPNDRVIQAYKKNNAYCNPTLATIGSSTAEGKDKQEKFAHDPRVQDKLGETERQRMCMCMSFATKYGTFENACESVRQLKKAGIDIVCGSDAASPAVGTAWGLSMHQELSLFVNNCGFTPAEALRSATYLPAKRLDFPDRGQIAEGMRADLVLIEGNVLEDIDRSLDMRAVWKGGVLCPYYDGKM